MSSALRLVIYDATQLSRGPRALGLSWKYGTRLYRGLGRTDGAYGAQGGHAGHHGHDGHDDAQPADLHHPGHGPHRSVPKIHQFKPAHK